jgi:outer membrane protein assembly factor BamB
MERVRPLAALLPVALAAGAIAVAGHAAEPSPTVVPRPPFAGPVGAVPDTGAVRLELVSSRFVDPAIIPPQPAAPAWAPRTYRGAELVLTSRQPGRTFLAYGAAGGQTRYLVAKGPRRGTRYVLDVTNLGRAASTWPLELRWAREVGGVLFVANAHRTYASTTGRRNGYLTALDPATGRVLWQSRSLVANADSFAVMGDVIVTGYGFTSEPDYLYALDRRTGRALARLPLPTGPELIASAGDTLTVRTYDHRVVARLHR